MASYLKTPDLSAHITAERMRLVIPSFPHWIEPTVEFLRERALLGGVCPPARAGKIMLALHEALSNSIIHGNLEVSSETKELATFAETLARATSDERLSSRTVEIDVTTNLRRCRWTLTDQGPGFDVDAVLGRVTHSDPEIVLASGRGILLMRSYLDRVDYKLGGRRVILTLNREKTRSAGLAAAADTAGSRPMAGFGDFNMRAVHRAVAFLIDKSVGLIESTDEHRVHPRVVYNERFEVLTTDSPHPLVGFARDLSMGGLAFITVHVLAGEIVVVLPAEEGEGPLRIRARVTRCVKIMDGLFDVGVQFIKME